MGIKGKILKLNFSSRTMRRDYDELHEMNT